MKIIFSIFFIFPLIVFSKPMSFATYKNKPKLVVVVVIDQFRADFLSRLQKDFLSESKLGFNHLMQTGAYFAQSNYNVLQAMTCPGHAMILSGSYPAQTSIQLNEWYSSEDRKKIYCAEDQEFGLSPRRLKTTTFGDEVKNLYPKSKVFAVSLKDRSAIFLGGHRADMSLWYDDEVNQWVTSKYYNDGKVPNWLATINKSQKIQNLLITSDLETSIKGTVATIDVALQALEKEKLGQRTDDGVDVLAVSLSNHDILGHAEGPESPNMKKLTLIEDQQISRLMSTLKKNLLLDNTVVVLTADHGVQPSPVLLKQNKIDSQGIDHINTIKELNKVLTEEFGSSGERGWVESVFLSHVYLNRQRIAEKKIDPEKIQKKVQEFYEKFPYVYRAITRAQILNAKIPYFDAREVVENSFVPDISGDVILILQPFHTDKTKNFATHQTMWSYDTTVPLIFWGPKWFAAGVHSGSRIVDIAPTLSFLTGVLPPPKSSGRVLNEAFR